MQRYNFSYDKENDDLFLYSLNSKSKASIAYESLIIDLNNRKEIVGLEIPNASQHLGDVSGCPASTVREALETLKDCLVDFEMKGKSACIRMTLVGKQKELSSVLAMPAHIGIIPAV